MRLILFVLLGTQFLSFSQEINQLDNKGLKHGLWKGVYKESNRPRYEGTFDHGKETGIFKFFDDTKAGTIIATRNFNPKDNSCYTIFFNQKSNKVSEGKLINKLYVGEWKYYHENSDSIMTKEFYINGKLNGIRKVYYPNGKLAEETTYKEGLKEGIYKKYAENGVVLEESIYKKDMYNGLAIFRNSKNEIVGQGLFKDDKKVGIWDIFENGKLVKKNMNFQGKKFQKRTKPLDQTYNK
jgi:antitoxin component YwqK of YwqJK toxin-antitoxin module